MGIIGHKSKDRPVIIQVAIRLIDPETDQPFGDMMFLPIEEFKKLVGISEYSAKAHEEKRRILLTVDEVS